MAGPFAALRLSCQDALQQRRAAGRSRCPRCGASRMFYCYSCHVLVQDLDPQRVPRVKVLLVFPRPGSLTLEKLMEKQRCARLGLPPIESSDHSREEHAAKRMKCLHGSQPIPGEKKVAGVAPFERAVFIDCTWNQTNKIILDERLQGLQCVELRKHETHFWRRQKGKPSTYLATIEALYYFLEEYEQLVLARPPTGSYDNLLFFYSYMYGLVHSAKADKLYHD
uniref:tRNA-uridine aminocarboxypropyltransferase 1 isoform X2 n=1 Tax=Myxine glutinosa TaxID=7769 RepID=UPI00358E3767